MNLDDLTSFSDEFIGEAYFKKEELIQIIESSLFKGLMCSFALVEVLPEVDTSDFSLDESELEVSFARSGGAGGQNVNKRETAVRMVHQQTGLSVFISEGRTQEHNRQRALEIMRSKLYQKHLHDEEKKMKGLSISDKVVIEWGSQMRSYVFDPYQMVKDHEKNIETRDVNGVLSGNLELFVA